MSASHPFWVSVFLDLEADVFEETIAFWCAVTGSTLSARRGDDGEFATLVPRDGDDHLRVQRLADGDSRIHVDLHVPDPDAAAEQAVALGAEIDWRSEHGYVVMASPAGLTFCFVSHPSAVRPSPMTWPGGHRSLVDQLCLDVPPAAFATEVDFWRELTGWESSASRVSADFVPFLRPEGQPFRLLVQRLQDPSDRIGAHLDLAVTDRPAETERHVALGARVVGVHSHWTVLLDPAGSAYCLTDRDPATGLLPGV
ncbi:MAG: VOC family protein [Actinobacteria bacterium]|uniref:Unannotated protein n=1 Tax=freshwater metagenome TaxID=449393 RepID=A0A6J6SD63_9ZZZZ|nr:VOC family protein [Actinomycetota bacterium]